VNTAAIDIGSDSVKWVTLELPNNTETRPRLIGWGRTPLPEGTLTGNFNKLGLEKANELERIVTASARSANIASLEAALTFPDQYVKIFFTELERLQDLTPRERAYTLWRIRQQLPASIVDDCIIDYQHLVTLNRETGPLFRLLVEVVREDVINSLAKTLNKARVWPAYLNCNSFCAYNLFEHTLVERVPEETPACLLHIGHYSTSFAFYRTGLIEYVRVLDYGWHNFIETWMEAQSKTRDEAIEDLRQTTLFPSSESENSENIVSLELFKKLFKEWCREIEATFTYHRTHYPYLGRSRVFLAGGGATLTNLPGFLESLIDAPTEYLDPADIIDIECASPPDAAERLGLVAAIGGALALTKLDSDGTDHAPEVAQ